MALRESDLLYSVEDYLAYERAATVRHEYVDGYLYEMAGETLPHGDICVSLTRIISTAILGTPCRALTKDTKVKSGPFANPRRTMKGMFSYPDLVVVCGQPQFHDDYKDILLNPTIIIEVLSPGTEAFDRGGKFLRYRNFSPSLTDYILVAQDRAVIDHFQRQEDGLWLLRTIQGLDSELHLAALGCVLSLREVYDRVEFPPPEEWEEIDSENDGHTIG